MPDWAFWLVVVLSWISGWGCHVLFSFFFPSK